MTVPVLPPGQRAWIDLLNAESDWVTDDVLLEVIPREARRFDDGAAWPKARALAYLVNNVQTLRANFERVESGRPPDVEALDPVLSSIRPRFVNWRAREDFGALRARRLERGEGLVFFQPGLDPEGGWNSATAHLRLVVQRAFWHFARYAEMRLGDPAWPGATEGSFRVFAVKGPAGRRLVASPAGWPPAP